MKHILKLRKKLTLLLAGLAVCLSASANSDEFDFASIKKEASSFSPRNTALRELFRSALLNTGSQMSAAADGTIFLKTGDIPAEWLRDSSAQVQPYLLFAKSDSKIAATLKKILLRQFKYMALDPYANAFNEDYSVWERKFELDSLAYPILLAWKYWQTTGDLSVFGPEAKAGFLRALETMELEQDHAGNSKYSHGELKGHAVGNTGMIWTGFRPSDDACEFNFLIPSEMMAERALLALTKIAQKAYNDTELASRASKLAKEVHEGIERYGMVTTKKFGRIYAYEVDGLGNFNLMDDANLPSLLSAPYFGYMKRTDTIYKNTRRFILSKENSYFYHGRFAEGVGSPHTPTGMVWPLSLLAQGLTSTSSLERRKMVNTLLASDPGDHRLHESFDPDNPKKLTREDFGWPNALFVEFVKTFPKAELNRLSAKLQQ